MKIICIGRNYKEHIKELNNNETKQPLIFLKPDTALLQKNQPFFYPDFSNNIQYETEIVLHINKVGKNISSKFAHKYYNKIGIGIDFTARDLQEEFKSKGHPWDLAKGFNGSAPVSREFIAKEDVADLNNIHFSLHKNGKTVQEGNTKDLLYKFDEIIAYISKFYLLKIGDLIFTGTPAGVGKVEIGDQLEAYIEDKKMLKVDIR